MNPTLNAHDLAQRILSGETQMLRVSEGTWGICLACYAFAKITRHHVCPKASVKPADWRGPTIIHLCRECHTAIHRHIPNEVLATHRTVADSVNAIRAARALKKAGNLHHHTRTNHAYPTYVPRAAEHRQVPG